MNLQSVLNWTNAILLEGFKDDVLSGYKKLGYDTEDKKLLTAIKTLNSENQIKELIKKEVGKVPNIGLAVAKKYTPEEFIGVVTKSKRELNTKRRKQKESQARAEAASSASDDYYIYPCRTFEEAHEAAFAHTGNLKRLSREDRERFFKEQYGIYIPSPATHYQTNKTPAEMLEFMKECPVFMEPTWCVCADKKYWSSYRLKATKKGNANCFVVISKTHPNVRFCITRDMEDCDSAKHSIDGDYVISMKCLGEFRDIWQIGGDDNFRVGMKMAKLAFGDITGLLNSIVEKQERVAFEELTDGSDVLSMNNMVTSFNKKLTSLVNGHGMFNRCSNLASFTSELPSLTDGYWMFANCLKLSSFTIELPKLTDGRHMFRYCTNLTTFTSELPNLTDGFGMFYSCSNLTSFTSNLPNLTNGYDMFYGCDNLTSFTSELLKLTDGYEMFKGCYNLTTFTGELPSLTNGFGMFYGCEKLTSFTSNLPNLTSGWGMFKGCKLDKASVINILTSIPKVVGKTIGIGAGYDYMKDDDTLRAVQDAKQKGWDVDFSK